MRFFKRCFLVFLCLVMALGLFACGQKREEDIIIVFSGDVHSAIDENIGYAGLVAYRKEAQAKSPYVTMVDVGDAIQGAALATASKGEAIVECLKAVNYDIQIMGNHELDYGLEKLSGLLGEMEGRYINSNVVYTGKNENNLINKADKYRIIEYGDTKVAYIGLLTPRALLSASPVNVQEDGEVAVDFCGGRADKDFYAFVQGLVDECKAQGADYVIALAHMGSEEADEPYSSTTLAESTKGIDVIIDGHSHLQYSCKSLVNAENKEVLVSSCGTQLQSIGQISISPSGLISVTNIVEYDKKDEETAAKINAVKEKYTAELEATLFTNDTPLTIKDDAGVRVVRNKEMPIGDLVADAYRYASGADIAMANSGGIRADLPTGDVSYADIMNVTPFGNLMAAIELTGQELVDYLEYVYRFTQIDYVTDGVNNCEYGSFMQVSGLKFTIDTSVTSDVTVDEDDNLISVGEQRRLKDVMVQNSEGVYEPIDLTKTYVVGGNDYSLLKGGSGTELFFQDKTVVIADAGADYDAVNTYIREVLHYDLSKYAQVDGRITLE